MEFPAGPRLKKVFVDRYLLHFYLLLLLLALHAVYCLILAIASARLAVAVCCLAGCRMPIAAFVQPELAKFAARYICMTFTSYCIWPFGDVSSYYRFRYRYEYIYLRTVGSVPIGTSSVRMYAHYTTCKSTYVQPYRSCTTYSSLTVHCTVRPSMHRFICWMGWI